MPPDPVRNGLSVDVEDWFQVGAFERTLDKADWDSLTPRVERNTDLVLALFAGSGVKATFFTLGWVAHRYPALIRRIVDAGHEIASHGWDHQRVFTMTAPEFRADLARARTALEDAGGVAVTGYRAPSFSIDARTPWAFAELAAAGYRYSSSVAPLAHDHYGWPEAPRYAFRPLADAELIELPVTVAQFGARRMATGGGFFRLLPAALTDFAVRQVNREGQPAVFYFHPWEIDPGQPRVTNAPLKSRLRHYARLGAMAGKLRELIARHEWGRVDEVVADLPRPQAFPRRTPGPSRELPSDEGQTPPTEFVATGPRPSPGKRKEAA
ncbi:XrtA system polysaccharide deacetylase [Sphingomonas sp.]|jgi:polysaccharide deacetylase family protein (PEP-CTERM system associated)|uniref:XrtA system polysaccharide deacetylase n=1 Tax=Sphingomonas sp. TaxID=28214 RepID=UPI002D809BDD|nr:XrtA system polysaccharide deacetylase [Sphingomonas sp.]HEU0043589.1 XrtA system polysaccharide deacetylase [Sphingomonas sp.]